MSRYRPPRKPSNLRLVSVDGNPSDLEARVIEAALHQLIESERAATTPSLWLRAGRAQGRRLGMYDYRDRFGHADAWRLSARFPAGGREYPGLAGRGDAR